MKRAIQGLQSKVLVTGESFLGFVPFPLPPKPELIFGSELRRELSRADQMVGRLDGLSTLIRHPEMLISFYIRKEAVLSSQIEGMPARRGRLYLYSEYIKMMDEGALVV
jgi:Fic family protein